MMKKSEKKGEANLDILFFYNMPFRGLINTTHGIFYKWNGGWICQNREWTSFNWIGENALVCYCKKMRLKNG